MFDNDLFISYAHRDNRSLDEEEKGWVTKFHEVLSHRLGGVLGKDPRIWRDPKIDGTDYVSDEIVSQLCGAALLIPILSPSFVNSKWCLKELKTFYKNAQEGLGVRVGNKSRIVKIIKLPVEKKHLVEIAENPGFEFFLNDNGIIRELSPGLNKKRTFEYLKRIENVVSSIRNLLAKLEGRERLAVYFARTSPELSDQGEMIKQELISNGYDVLTESPHLKVESELHKSVSSLLDKSILSIHLVGGSYGQILENSKKSIVELLYELAGEKSNNGKLEQLICLLPGSIIKSKEQDAFIKNLRTGANTWNRTDIIEGSIEDFKNAINEKLEQIKKVKADANRKNISPTDGQGSPRRLIYLICDQGDISDDNKKLLEDQLFDSGFTVIPKAFDGEPMELMQDHIENLKFCDAVLIYYGAGNETWARGVIRDLYKIKGYGRTRPLHVKWLYLAPPETRPKIHFPFRDLPTIDGLEGFSEEKMTPFIEVLNTLKDEDE